MRRPATGHSIARGARCWAGRPRLTACCSSAAMRLTSTAGRRWAARGWSYDDIKQYFKSIERYAPGDPGRAWQVGTYAGRGLPDGPAAHAPLRGSGPAGRAQPFREGPERPTACGGRGLLADVAQRALPGLHRPHLPARCARAPRTCGSRPTPTQPGSSFDGTRCTGVAFRQRGQGPARSGRAREVIVSGGTVNSPHLLHLSGVGPAERLRDIGIEVRHDLPGVGMNYSDHLHRTHLPPGARPAVNQPAGARLAAGAGDGALRTARKRSAHVRRLQRAMLHALARRAGLA